MSTAITVVRDRNGLIKRATVDAPAVVSVETIKAVAQEVADAIAKVVAPVVAPSAPSGLSLAEAQAMAKEAVEALALPARDQAVADAVAAHVRKSYDAVLPARDQAVADAVAAKVRESYIETLKKIQAGLAAGRFEITFGSGRRFQVTAIDVTEGYR